MSFHVKRKKMQQWSRSADAWMNGQDEIEGLKLKIYWNLYIFSPYKLLNTITFSYEVENARNELRWLRFVEHYAMELDWNRLELVKISGKIKRVFNFIRNKTLELHWNQGECFITLTTYWISLWLLSLILWSDINFICRCLIEFNCYIDCHSN